MPDSGTLALSSSMFSFCSIRLALRALSLSPTIYSNVFWNTTEREILLQGEKG